jgi:ATP-binding cassette subfamily C protein
VVLDEPNANLDAAGEEALLHAIQRLKALGTTVAIVTHKVNVLAAADKILIMNAGTVQAFGARDEILSRLAGPKVVQKPALAPQPGAPQLRAEPPMPQRAVGAE